MDVGRPLELCGVGVPGADVACLELLELLLGAKFVCLWWIVRMRVLGMRRSLPCLRILGFGLGSDCCYDEVEYRSAMMSFVGFNLRI